MPRLMFSIFLGLEVGVETIFRVMFVRDVMSYPKIFFK